MPGLLTLNTDLKSLKYGHDQPNGGSSNEPYIKVDINSVDATFNRVRLTKFDDGLIRGGAVGAINASAVDTLRISKFLTDFPKGPLFLIKQVGLQLSNPRLEIPKDPGNISSGGAANQLSLSTKGLLQPTRVYNLGGNTLAQVPTVAFGLHFDRHGLSPIQNDASKYEAIATANNEKNNRLVGLLNKFTKNPSETIIDQYLGGPGSVYGIGQTLIHRATTPGYKGIIVDYSNNNAGNPLVNGQRQTFTYIDTSTLNGAVSSDLGQRNKFSEWNKTHRIGGTAYIGAADKFGAYSDTITDPIQLAKGVDQSVYGDNNPTSQLLQKSNNYSNGKSRITSDTIKIKDTIDYGLSEKTESIFSDTDFPTLPEQIDKNKSLLLNPSKSTDKGQHDRNQDLPQQDNKNDLTSDGPSSYPDPAYPSASFSNNLDLPNLAYNYGSPSIKSYQKIIDEVSKTIKTGTDNATSQKDLGLYRHDISVKTGTSLSDFDRTIDTNVDNDTLAIKFTPIDPFGRTFQTISFLAYLNDYSDTFDSSWGDVKYVGRAEKFYIFNEFKRSISFGFNIPCFNKEDLTQQHFKLNNLTSILAGTYEGGLLGGIITRLKLGNYVDNQPGIITSLNFSPIQDASWDLDNQLAFYIKVTVGFTLIHDMLPKYKAKFINYNNENTLKPKKKKKAQIIIPDEPSGVSGGRSKDNAPYFPNTTTSTNEPNTNPTTQQQVNYFRYDANGNVDAKFNSDGNLVESYNPAVDPSTVIT